MMMQCGRHGVQFVGEAQVVWACSAVSGGHSGEPGVTAYVQCALLPLGTCRSSMTPRSTGKRA